MAKFNAKTKNENLTLINHQTKLLCVQQPMDLSS